MGDRIPEGWRECKLGEVAEINRNSIGNEYLQKKILYLDTSSIIRGKINCYQKFLLSDAPSRAKRLVKDKDIIYSTVRPIQRHYGIIKNPPQNLVVSTGFAVIETNQKKADSVFIYYFLTSDEIVEYLDVIAEASTSAYPSLRPSDIENLDILLPPLPEQRAIASVLSSLDDKIDLLNRENKTLEQIAESLFRQWFIEEADEEWETGLLGDFVNMVYGKNLLTKNLKNSGYPVFGGNGQIGFFDKYIYEKPQVLVSCRGEASGTVNVSLPKSFVTNNSLILEINKREEVTFEYLKYYALNTDFKMYVSGSAQPQITITDLYAAGFVLPDRKIIDYFSDIVRICESKMTNNRSQLRTLEKLRDTLLPKLMSGEVRVEI